MPWVQEVIIMSALNEKLKDIYQTYKDHENPPVPVKKIKECLKLSGVLLENNILFRGF